MTARAAALLAVAFVLCGGILSGCVATPPQGPTDADMQDFNQQLLNKTWARTGLAGVAERPQVRREDALEEGEWYSAMGECMADGGITGFGTTYSTDAGFEYVPMNEAEEIPPADQLLFYSCVARHPMVPGGYFESLTDEQLNYIYDYYQTTLVPCMIMNGFAPTTAPTRVEFLALAGQWNPYYSVDVGLDPGQYEEIRRICGAERPQLY